MKLFISSSLLMAKKTGICTHLQEFKYVADNQTTQTQTKRGSIVDSCI